MTHSNIQRSGYHLYKLHRYSVDVGLSSLAILSVLKRSLGIELAHAYSVLLFFSVLFIYNLDHYLDRRKHRNEHLGIVLTSLFINLLLLINLFHSEFSLVAYGVPLMGVILIYLTLIHFYERHLFYGKEIVVALFFTLGILGPVIYPILTNPSTPIPLTGLLQVLTILFFVILHNACIESYLNRGKDDSYHTPSLWLELSKQKSDEGREKINGLKSINLLGFFNLILILSWRINAPKLTGYFLLMTVLQQIILNLGRSEPEEKLQLFLLNSIFILGFLF